jgi:pyruvate dehydrogenase E1 component alpha subunit
MPRKKINIPLKLEYLSILDEQGKVDKKLDPGLSEEFLIRLYGGMVLGRRFDERLLSLQRQGRIGTFAPITGQEAAQLGAVSVLEPTDWFVPSFRETGAELWRGRTIESIVMAFGGFSEPLDPDSGEERMNNLPVAVPVASQIPHGVGLAWGIKYRKKKDVAMVFFGDGATSEGDFHEGLNFAGVYQVPVIFICQNNHWAISVPRSKQTRSETLAQKAIAYGMPGIQVDGNDIFAVHVAAKEAVDRARAGKGPTLIECVTYRMMMHTTADDPLRYRKEEEVNAWRERDPLTRLRRYLKDKGVGEERFEAIEEKVKGEIQSALERAEEKMKGLLQKPIRMFDHIFADMPPTLKDQREELARELARTEEKNHG